MKTSDPEALEAAKREFIKEYNRQQLRAGLSLALTLAVAVVLYRGLPAPWNGVALAWGPAVAMTGMLLLRPQSMLGRNGSKVPAIILISFLWVVAIGSVVVTFLGIR